MLAEELMAVQTPAWVMDQRQLLKNLQQLVEIKRQCGCKILYSIKALPLQQVLELALPYVDGFSVSSLYEARLAHKILPAEGDIHLTTPGLRAQECAELSGLCTQISFNSLSQKARMQAQLHTVSCGVRINPKLSFLDDDRYDPCRFASKLGVDIHILEQMAIDTTIQGFHWHTVFSKTEITPLYRTVERLQTLLQKYKQSIQWLNLGGGYLFSEMDNPAIFIQTVKTLRQQFDVDVYIEPGKAVIGNAGYLVSQVVDCYTSDGENIAVLDSSVNHHPEVFEYQRSPAVFFPAAGDEDVILAGSSCLAGDVFGKYSFVRQPVIGDYVVFQDVGAYSLVKASRFNGYPLPAVYCLNGTGCQRVRSDEYATFEAQWITKVE